MSAPTTELHTCPVCRRRIALSGGVAPVFYRHNDTRGSWCPMSGKPLPPPDAAEQPWTS